MMSMPRLMKYSEYCSKTSGSLLQYCRDERDDADITDSQLFKLKEKLTNNTGYAGPVMPITDCNI